MQEKNNAVWQAKLKIANTINGEKVLYAITDIEMVEGPGTSGTTTTYGIVTEPGKEVKNQSPENLNSDKHNEYEAEDGKRYTAEELAAMSEDEFLDIMAELNPRTVYDIPEIRELLKLQSKETKGKVYSASSIRA